MSIHTENVTYHQNGIEMRGYLAFEDGGAETRPGILVFPEWWGVNEYIKERTRMVAALGYVALGVDMFGEGALAANADEANAKMNEVLNDMKTGTARIRAANDFLRSRPGVDDERIGAIGYCFGGAMALHAARIGMDLRAVVSFHAALGSFHKPAPGEVKAKLLVCHGTADAMVSESDAAAFKQEMADAEADLEFVTYEGAQHGFTSKEASVNSKKYGLPIGYDESADKDSWRRMREFLAAAM